MPDSNGKQQTIEERLRALETMFAQQSVLIQSLIDQHARIISLLESRMGIERKEQKEFGVN